MCLDGGRRPLDLVDVNLPSGDAVMTLGGSVASPQRLDESRRGAPPTYHVFLSLLLLNFESEARAEDSRGQREEGDAEEGADAGDHLPLPGDGDAVPVAHRADRDEAPPKSMSKRPEHLGVLVLLHLVDDEAGEHEDQEPNVEGGEELLPVGVDHGAEEFPGAAPSVHPDHAEDLEEPEAPEGGGGVHLVPVAREDDHRGRDGHDVDHAERALEELCPADPALVSWVNILPKNS